MLSFFKSITSPSPGFPVLGIFHQYDHIPFQCLIEPHNSVLIDLADRLQKDSRIYVFYKAN